MNSQYIPNFLQWIDILNQNNSCYKEKNNQQKREQNMLFSIHCLNLVQYHFPGNNIADTLLCHSPSLAKTR